MIVFAISHGAASIYRTDALFAALPINNLLAYTMLEHPSEPGTASDATIKRRGNNSAEHRPCENTSVGSVFGRVAIKAESIAVQFCRWNCGRRPAGRWQQWTRENIGDHLAGQGGGWGASLEHRTATIACTKQPSFLLESSVERDAIYKFMSKKRFALVGEAPGQCSSKTK